MVSAKMCANDELRTVANILWMVSAKISGLFKVAVRFATRRRLMAESDREIADSK